MEGLYPRLGMAARDHLRRHRPAHDSRALQLFPTCWREDGLRAPAGDSARSQVNAVVPYEVAGQTSTQIELIVQGNPTNSVTVPVVAASPGVFVIKIGRAHV